VIGAGPAGLSSLIAFQHAADKGDPIPDIVCYEKQSDWGGLWNYSWRTGVDATGNPVHSSMYKYLWSNAPKECLEFGNYSFKEHFTREIASYPPRPVLLDYIAGRAVKAGVRDRIQFNTAVQSVVWDQQTSQFLVSSVTARALNNGDKGATRTCATERFDFVLVASGHYCFPNYPHFDGFEQFQGRILHAHDMRDACEFKGLEILLIGTSYSAEDIASQCHKYGAKTIYISHKEHPIGYSTWAQNIVEVPSLIKLASSLSDGGERGGMAYFKDGSTRRVDVVILCTGYNHHFPFLPNDLAINPDTTPGQPANKIWLKGLYRGMFWIKNPKLIHIGPHTGFFTMPMFDAQAWLCRDYILGKYTLPSLAEMSAHDTMMCKRTDALEAHATCQGEYDHACIDFQGNYVKELFDLTDYPHMNMDEYKNRFYEWEAHKQENIMTFRDNCYKNCHTGEMSPMLTGPDGGQILWKDAMREDCESYGLWDLYNRNARKTKSKL